MLEPLLAPGEKPLPRLAQASLQTSLADTPVVLIQGPRQCGKTTLVRTVAEPLGAGGTPERVGWTCNAAAHC